MSKRGVEEAMFPILTSLAAGSQHGYWIVTDVENVSGGPGPTAPLERCLNSGQESGSHYTQPPG